MSIIPVFGHSPSPGSWFKDNDGDAMTVTDPAPVNSNVGGTGSSVWNRIDYSTDVVITHDPRNTQKDISIWLKRLRLEVADTCDIDCMARGSGMTAVAVLNTISLGIIALNAFIMIMGANNKGSRVCSVFLTLPACAFQAIVLITSGAMLFSPFAQLCGYSTTKTGNYPVMSLLAGDSWMMMNDYWTMVGLWFAQIVLMFVFCCCGLIGAYKPTGTAGGKQTMDLDFD